MDSVRLIFGCTSPRFVYLTFSTVNLYMYTNHICLGKIVYICKIYVKNVKTKDLSKRIQNRKSKLILYSTQRVTLEKYVLRTIV